MRINMLCLIPVLLSSYASARDLTVRVHNESTRSCISVRICPPERWNSHWGSACTQAQCTGNGIAAEFVISDSDPYFASAFASGKLAHEGLTVELSYSGRATSYMACTQTFTVLNSDDPIDISVTAFSSLGLSRPTCELD